MARLEEGTGRVTGLAVATPYSDLCDPPEHPEDVPLTKILVTRASSLCTLLINLITPMLLA